MFANGFRKMVEHWEDKKADKGGKGRGGFSKLGPTTKKKQKKKVGGEWLRGGQIVRALTGHAARL